MKVKWDKAACIITKSKLIVPLQLTVTARGLAPDGTDKSFGVRWIQSGILFAADDLTSYEKQVLYSLFKCTEIARNTFFFAHISDYQFGATWINCGILLASYGIIIIIIHVV